ncbi:MAG: hypothetical protein MUP80_03890 [Acidobacteriia bacterium]|nr:hypothetical protein [Terriglobia bacterium]
MRRVIVSVFPMLLVPLLLSAQDARNSWNNLKQLRVGEKIQVVDQKLKSLTGTFVGVTEEAISLQVGPAPVAVQRVDVLRVTSRERTRRGRNALIGLGIGAAAGAVGLAIYAEKATHGPVYDRWVPIAAGVFWGGAVGAGVGAAFPSHPTIYRSERRKDQSKP